MKKGIFIIVFSSIIFTFYSMSEVDFQEMRDKFKSHYVEDDYLQDENILFQ